MNECEKKLESNATIEKNILDIIMKQLNLIKTNVRMLTLKRKDAIIRKANDLYVDFS